MSVILAAPHGPKRKAKGQGAERRDEIVAAALTLFATHGVHGVSTRQIADAVGVSQPTLYAYFATKDAILREVCEAAFRELADRMRRALAEAGDADGMCVIGREYIRFGLEQPDAYRIAFMIEGSHGGEKPEAHKMVGLDTFMILRNHVAATVATDEASVEIVSQSAWACMHGLTSLLIARPGFPWADIDELIDAHLKATVRAWGGATASAEQP